MELTMKTFLIIGPLVFWGGIVDAMGGGGGLITLPAYMLAGLPAHFAIATNKLSATCGTLVAAIKFLRERLVNFKLVLPAMLNAVVGSLIGARLSLMTDEKYLKVIMIPILAIAAFFVLNKNMFGKEYPDEIVLSRRTCIITSVSALVVGVYDGFYGPGTGTFLIIALNTFAHLNIKSANAQTKIINMTTNVSSLCVFIMEGQIIWMLGIVAALCGMAGNYIGASLAISKGSKITKPVILIVLGLLLLKIVLGL